MRAAVRSASARSVSGLRAGSALTIGGGGNDLSKAIALLRSVGGRMYLPGLTSRVASDGSGGSPVAGDVIGWLPDRVSGANAATQSTTGFKPKLIREPILGPELVVNGDFSNGTTGWSVTSPTQASISSDSGELAVSVTTGVAGGVQSQTTAAGRTYQISALVRRGTTADVKLRANNGTFTGAIIAETKAITSTTTTAVSITATALSETTVIYLRCGGVGTGYFDNISVREILGYTERYSLEFDGVDDVLYANTAIPFAQGLMLCVALSPQAVVPSGSAPQIYVSCRARSGSPSIGISQEYNAAGNKIVCQISDGPRSQWASLVHPPLSGWHVWTALWANDRLQLRKNGVLVSDNSAAGILADGAIDFINVGSNRLSTPYNFANARIQAPVVASGITTLAEIQQIERAVAAAAGITL